MKNIAEYINENLTATEVGKKTINGSWEDHGKKIANAWKTIPSDLKSVLEDSIYDDIKSFYDNTPKKRNVSSMCMVIVKLNLESDPIYKKLKSLYGKIGMDYWMTRFPLEICSGEITGVSTSREGSSDRTKISMKEHFYNSWRKPNDELANGYNNLPGEIITHYRNELMKCINGSEVVVSKDKVRNFKASANVPRYTVIYNAIYDKSKVNKLIEEINKEIESGKLNRYVKSLGATSRALDDYYSSKRSGEYTGD